AWLRGTTAMEPHALRRVTWSTATSRTTTAGGSNWPESEADDALPRHGPGGARCRVQQHRRRGPGRARSVRRRLGDPQRQAPEGSGRLDRRPLRRRSAAAPRRLRVRHAAGADARVHPRRLLADERQGAVRLPGRGRPRRRVQPGPRGVHAGAGGAARRDRRGGAPGGLGERPELIRQSEEYARAWQQHGLPGEYLPVARHDHFSILEELARPTGKILGALGALSRKRG